MLLTLYPHFNLWQKVLLIQVKTHEKPWFAIMRALFAPVAQLDRVLVSEAKGRGFDSRRAHQYSEKAYSN